MFKSGPRNFNFRGDALRRINWAHPHAYGLKFAMVNIGGVPYDLVSGKPASTFSTDTSVTGRGRATVFDSTLDEYAQWPVPEALIDPTFLSVVVSKETWDNGTGIDEYIVSTGSATTGNRGWALFEGMPGGTNKWFWHWRIIGISTKAISTYNGTAYDDGEVVAYSIALEPGSGNIPVSASMDSSNAFLNLDHGSETPAAITPNTTDGIITVGGRLDSGSNYADGAMEYVFVYDRLLTRQEQHEIMAAPFAMMQPVTRFAFAAPAAAGGTPRQWMNPLTGEVFNETQDGKQWINPLTGAVLDEQIAAVAATATPHYPFGLAFSGPFRGPIG